jgi:hypothetical protein
MDHAIEDSWKGVRGDMLRLAAANLHQHRAQHSHGLTQGDGGGKGSGTHCGEGATACGPCLHADAFNRWEREGERDGVIEGRGLQ